MSGNAASWYSVIINSLATVADGLMICIIVGFLLFCAVNKVRQWWSGADREKPVGESRSEPRKNEDDDDRRWTDDDDRYWDRFQ